MAAVAAIDNPIASRAKPATVEALHMNIPTVAVRRMVPPLCRRLCLRPAQRRWRPVLLKLLIQRLKQRTLRSGNSGSRPTPRSTRRTWPCTSSSMRRTMISKPVRTERLGSQDTQATVQVTPLGRGSHLPRLATMPARLQVERQELQEDSTPFRLRLECRRHGEAVTGGRELLVCRTVCQMTLSVLMHARVAQVWSIT